MQMLSRGDNAVVVLVHHHAYTTPLLNEQKLASICMHMSPKFPQ
jgi:hypothetical protein